MKIKAIKLQEVLGEDAGMATNCWSKETRQIKEDEEYGYYYPYSEPGTNENTSIYSSIDAFY